VVAIICKDGLNVQPFGLISKHFLLVSPQPDYTTIEQYPLEIRFVTFSVHVFSFLDLPGCNDLMNAY
jgi:hypothetical protein